MRSLNRKGIKKLGAVIEKLVQKKRYTTLKNLLPSYFPSDINTAMREMSVKEIADILKVLNPSVFLGVFEYLASETQAEVLEYLRESDIKYIFKNLPSDDKTLLLRNLNEESQEHILSLLSEKERKTAKHHLNYDEDEAASIASDYFVTIYDYFLVSEALEFLKATNEKTENFYTVYIIDKSQQLVGFVDLNKLVFSNSSDLVKDIMVKDVIFIQDVDSEDKAVEMMNHYDISILPVVNDKKEMVGIITYDDIMDIVIQKGTEDFQKFAGLTGSDRSQDSYFKQSVWKQAQRRFTWILIPVFMEIVTGLIVHSHEKLLQQFFILTLFIPMLTAAGGGIGSQSASMIIRSIALKEVSLKDILSIIWREIRVSCLIAIVVLVVFVIGMQGEHMAQMNKIILVVCISMFAQLTTSSVFGATIPLVACGLRLDPALIASPIVSSLVDISGMLIYFLTAKMILIP